MWLMGCSQQDVTPDFPAILHGYARNDYFEGISDPLELGVVALQNGDKKVLILTVDTLGITMHDCRRLYPVIEEATGIGYPDIYICGAHTHFAPNFASCYITLPGGPIPLGLEPPDDRYFNFFVERLRTALRAALDSLEPVTLEHAEIPLPALHFNRRTIEKATGKCVNNYTYPANPDDYIFPPVDPAMSVWRFQKADGQTKAILARYSCHPVTGGGNNELVSADFPGYFRKAVKETLACPAFFMQGCAGDVVPMRRDGNCRADIGDVMAKSIRMAELTFRKVSDETLATATLEVPAQLTRFPKGYRAEADARWAQAVAHAKTLDHYDNDLWAESYRHGAAKLYPEDVVQIPLQGLRLGDRILVGAPFEVVSAIGLKLREECPNAVMTTFTGGYEMYLPVKADFAKGGYETEWGANFAPETGDNIAASAVKLARQMTK